MKFTNEYLNYYGITPMPQDFDEYWDKSVLEMKMIQPNVELKKVMDFPTVECFDMYFTGVGGARIYAKFARPKNITKPTGAVVCFHGYHANFPEWHRLLTFAGQGLCVAAMDCRGQNGKSMDNSTVIGNTITGHIVRGMCDNDPKKLLFRSIYLDAAELANIIMNFDYIDASGIYSFGNSQGGGLAVACAALEPNIKKTVISCPFLCDIQRAYELEGVAFSEIQQYFKFADPRHETEEYVFTRIGYIDVKNLAHRVKAGVKMFTGMQDTACPPITQFAMYNNLNTEKEYYIYPDYAHAEYPEAVDIALKWFCEN